MAQNGEVRVWVPMDAASFAAFTPGAVLTGREGLAVTSGWADVAGETDLDVLEGMRLEGTQAEVVVVVEAAAQVRDEVAGQVVVGAGLAHVAAYFVADSEGDFSWFGPTEWAAARLAAADWHSS